MLNINYLVHININLDESRLFGQTHGHGGRFLISLKLHMLIDAILKNINLIEKLNEYLSINVTVHRLFAINLKLIGLFEKQMIIFKLA